jgi:hypothetical protein
MSKKSNARGITIPNFKLYYRAITIWLWHKNRYEDNGIEKMTQIWTHTSTPTWFLTTVPKHTMEKRQSHQMLLGKLAICI